MKNLREPLIPGLREEKKSMSGEPKLAPEEYKSEFQLKIWRLSEKQWILLQHVSGAIFGALGAAVMFLFYRSEVIGRYSFLITAVLLLLCPSVFEKQMNRGTAMKLRITILVVFAVCLIVFLLLHFLWEGLL